MPTLVKIQPDLAVTAMSKDVFAAVPPSHNDGERHGVGGSDHEWSFISFFFLAYQNLPTSRGQSDNGSLSSLPCGGKDHTTCRTTEAAYIEVGWE
jgi:hypothetical protein